MEKTILLMNGTNDSGGAWGSFGLYVGLTKTSQTELYTLELSLNGTKFRVSLVPDGDTIIDENVRNATPDDGHLELSGVATIDQAQGVVNFTGTYTAGNYCTVSLTEAVIAQLDEAVLEESASG